MYVYLRWTRPHICCALQTVFPDLGKCPYIDLGNIYIYNFGTSEIFL